MGSTVRNLELTLGEWFPPPLCKEICAEPHELQTVLEALEDTIRPAGAPP